MEFFRLNGDTIENAQSFAPCSSCETGHTTVWGPYLQFAPDQSEERKQLVVDLLNGNVAEAADVG